MLHLIGKNLWARRYRNGWLLAELIIVSMVIWVLTDPIVVTTHDRGLPTGITEEGMYRLNLAAVSSKSARFEAGEDTPEARAANVRRILSRIRDYEDVRYGISVTSRQPITASVLLCCGLQVPKYIFRCPRSTNLSLLWNRQ